MATTRPTIRGASVEDAAACAEIYAPYVTGTAVSFETEPPDAAGMAERIVAAVRTHAWIVLEQDGRVRGYAYGGPFKARPAYRWACEVSVYVEPGRHRTGGRPAALREPVRAGSPSAATAPPPRA